MPHVSVRQLGPKDETAAAEELLIRFFREEHFTTQADLIRRHCRHLATVDSCGLFVAEKAGDAVGVATVSMQYGIEFGWLGEMGDLYVLPASRGIGIARELIRAVEEFLKARGAAGYQVTLTPYAQSAHGMLEFYRKFGFAGEGREILYRHL
jgi:ribosomal protein S18 acetylase RimI-like enzyme